jgi:hypothetical protein
MNLIILEIAWGGLVNDLDALPAVRESTVRIELKVFDGS